MRRNRARGEGLANLALDCVSAGQSGAIRPNYIHSFAVVLKGGRVMNAFFVNYSTVAFPLHLPTLKRQQFFGAVANSLEKNSYFPLPLDVRRRVAPTGEEVDARQRGVN